MGQHDPQVVLALATRAHNVCETVSGHSPYAWVFGVNGLEDIDADEFYHKHGLERRSKTKEFTSLMSQRQRA